MSDSSDAESISNVDPQVIDIVEIGNLDMPPSRLISPPGATYEDLEEQINQIESNHNLRVVVPHFGPYTFFRYPLQSEATSSSTRRVFVFDGNKYESLIVVRTAEEDKVIPINLSEETSQPPATDVITAHVMAQGYSPISVKNYAELSSIGSKNPLYTIGSSSKAHPTIALVETMSEGCHFQTEFKRDDPVTESLKFLLARGEAFVQRASTIANDDLRLVHLARALVHLIVSLQEVENSNKAPEAVEYSNDLHRIIDKLEDFIEVINDSEDVLIRVFDELCDDRPGAISVRHSYDMFSKLNTREESLPEQAHPNITRPPPLGSVVTKSRQTGSSSEAGNYVSSSIAGISMEHWKNVEDSGMDGSKGFTQSGLQQYHLQDTFPTQLSTYSAPGSYQIQSPHHPNLNPLPFAFTSSEYPGLISANPDSSHEMVAAKKSMKSYLTSSNLEKMDGRQSETPIPASFSIRSFPPSPLRDKTRPLEVNPSDSRAQQSNSAIPIDINLSMEQVMDDYLVRYLNYLCINPGAKDHMGNQIQQTYIERRLQRYEQLYGWRPLRFRIESLVNGFVHLLAAVGISPDVVAKAPRYLNTSRLFSRFNEYGNRMKSQGQTIWCVRARAKNALDVEASKATSVTMLVTDYQIRSPERADPSHILPREPRDPVLSSTSSTKEDIQGLMICSDPLPWEFLPYERCIVGQPPLAIVGMAWQWNLKIHDHWTPRRKFNWNIFSSSLNVPVDVNQTSIDSGVLNTSMGSSLPNWLLLQDSKLMGTPTHPGVYPITIEATSQEDHDPEPIVIRGTFTINVFRAAGGRMPLQDEIKDAINEFGDEESEDRESNFVEISRRPMY